MPNKPSAAAATTTPVLQWTGDPEADALNSGDPVAMLIGFCLDQQILVEKAFMGPLTIRERLGTLDADQLARLPADRFEAAFRQAPSIHRYPASMAQRVQALCAVISDQYAGDAEAIWRDVTDANELKRRILALPGFGVMKTSVVCGVLANHFGIRPTGWRAVIPKVPTLADVHTVAERQKYQAAKRAAKAAKRAAE